MLRYVRGGGGGRYALDRPTSPAASRLPCAARDRRGPRVFERSELARTPPEASTARKPEGPAQWGRSARTACRAPVPKTKTTRRTSSHPPQAAHIIDGPQISLDHPRIRLHLRR